MPHFTALASEIISLVVADLANDQDALRALSLTSKFLLRHTRPILLRNLLCAADPVTVDFSPALNWLGTQAGGGLTQVARSLTLDGRVLDDGGEVVSAKLDPCVARSFLALLPFVAELRIRGVVWDGCEIEHVHIDSLTPFPRIRRIDLSDLLVCTPRLTDDVFTLFRGTPNCCVATIRRIRWSVFELPLDRPPVVLYRHRHVLAPLRDLEMRDMLPTDSWRVRGMLARTCNTLATVYIGAAVDSSGSYDLVSCSHSRKLTFAVTSSDRSSVAGHIPQDMQVEEIRVFHSTALRYVDLRCGREISCGCGFTQTGSPHVFCRRGVLRLQRYEPPYR